MGNGGERGASYSAKLVGVGDADIVDGSPPRFVGNRRFVWSSVQEMVLGVEVKFDVGCWLGMYYLLLS